MDNFRIVISITRGTNAGRALSLMANGISVSGESLERANELVEKYLDCAHAVLESCDKGQCYGLVQILDIINMKLERTEILQGMK